MHTLPNFVGWLLPAASGPNNFFCFRKMDPPARYSGFSDELPEGFHLNIKSAPRSLFLSDILFHSY